MDGKFFTVKEFECKCGCGAGIVDAHLVSKLDYARGMAGVPFRINSGFRCKAHNTAVGGHPESQHLVGRAADIRAVSRGIRYDIVRALMMSGFNRIGIGREFVHVDILPTHNHVIWTYEDK